MEKLLETFLSEINVKSKGKDTDSVQAYEL